MPYALTLHRNMDISSVHSNHPGHLAPGDCLLTLQGVEGVKRPKQKTTGIAGGSQKASSVGIYSGKTANSSQQIKGTTPHPIPLPLRMN